MVGGFFGPPAVPVMAGPEAAGGRGVVPMRPTKEKTARNGLERPGTAWNGARRQLRLPFFVVVVVVVVVSRRVVAHRPRYSQPKAPPPPKKKDKTQTVRAGSIPDSQGLRAKIRARIGFQRDTSGFTKSSFSNRRAAGTIKGENKC